MDILKWFISAVVFNDLTLIINGYSYTGERSIRSSVLSSFAYDRMARPNDTTTAKVGYNLLAINDVDIDKQLFSCTGWFTMLWTDDRLVWDPDVYDDTEYIHALETEIWKPEILISNEQTSVGLVSDDHLIYRIKYTGEVEWEPLISTSVDCSVEATYFPFDNQECTIEITSWGLPDTELSLQLLWETVSLDEFRESGTWTIAGTSVSPSFVRESVHGVIENFSRIIFTFRMTRKSGNYVFNTILPIILSSFLMSITNLIPLKTGERVVSGFLVLVINTILLTIFMQQIPNIATTTAILGIYLIGSLCIDYVRMFVTVAMAKLHHKSTKYTTVGRKVTGLALIVKKLVCFKVNISDKPVESDRISLLSIPTDDLKKIEKTLSPRRNIVSPENNDSSNFTETVKIKESALPVLSSKYEVDMRNARARKLEKQTDKADGDFADFAGSQSDLNWDSVATIFDRLWFLVFLVVKIVFNGMLIGNLFYQRNKGFDDPKPTE